MLHLISSAGMFLVRSLCLLDVARVASCALEGQLLAGARVRARARRAVPGHACKVVVRQGAAVLVVLRGAAGLPQLHRAAGQALQRSDEARDCPLPRIALGIYLPARMAQEGQAHATVDLLFSTDSAMNYILLILWTQIKSGFCSTVSGRHPFALVEM